MSFIYSFEIIKAVVPEPCIFFGIPASIAEAAGIVRNGVKIFFANETAALIMGLLIYLIMILKVLQIELF